MWHSFMGAETAKTCHLCTAPDEHKLKPFPCLSYHIKPTWDTAQLHVQGHVSEVLPYRVDLLPPLGRWSCFTSSFVCFIWVNLILHPYMGFWRQQNLFFHHLVFFSASFPLISFNRNLSWGMALTPAVIHTSQLSSSFFSSFPLHCCSSSSYNFHNPYRGFTNPSGLTVFLPDYSLSRTDRNSQVM